MNWKNSVNPAQILINYLVEVDGKRELDRLFLDINDIAVGLEKKGIDADVYFNGYREIGCLRSSILSNELRAWESSGFIERHESIVDNGLEPIIIIKFSDIAWKLLEKEDKLDNSLNGNLEDHVKNALAETIKHVVSNVPSLSSLS